MIWKISLSKEQINQVLKRSFLTNPPTPPNVLVLANGVNSNQTKSILFVHTLDRNRYPEVFSQREKYASSFFGVACKNEVEFVRYQNSKIEIEMPLRESNGDMNQETDSSKIEEVLKNAHQLFLDLLDEKYLIVFLKVTNTIIFSVQAC